MCLWDIFHGFGFNCFISGAGFCGGLESRRRESGFRRTRSSFETVDELMSMRLSLNIRFLSKGDLAFFCDVWNQKLYKRDICVLYR